jgi:hypothetical protein
VRGTAGDAPFQRCGNARSLQQLGQIVYKTITGGNGKDVFGATGLRSPLPRSRWLGVGGFATTVKRMFDISSPSAVVFGLTHGAKFEITRP